MRKLLVMGALVLASPAVSEAYECEMRHRGSGGWIGERMVLAMDRDEEVGGVMDWAVLEVHKVPMPVDVKKRKDHIWRFDWTVDGVRSNNVGTLKVSYTAMLNTKRNRVNVRGRLHGYDNQISGSGPCRRIE